MLILVVVLVVIFAPAVGCTVHSYRRLGHLPEFEDDYDLRVLRAEGARRDALGRVVFPEVPEHPNAVKP